VTHNVEAERAILGAVLLEGAGHTCAQIIGTVDAEDFWTESHRAIWRSVLRVWEDTQTVDTLLVGNDLREHDELQIAGGRAVLSRLVTAIPTVVNWRHYFDQVKEARRRREAIGAGNALVAAIENGEDPFEAAEAAIDSLAVISSDAPKRELPSFQRVGKRFVDWMEANYEQYNRLGRSPQWRAGWTKIDGVRDGLDECLPLTPGKSMILAGRSGSGKSGLALQCLINTAIEYEEPGLFISLEMTAETAYMRAMTRRVAVSESRILRGDLHPPPDVVEEMKRKGELTPYERIARFVNIHGRAPLHIDDQCPAEVSAVDRRIRAAADQGVKWVVVDYLQLISWPGRKFDRLSLEVGAVAYRLHHTAARVGVGLCLLAQLRKSLEMSVPTTNDIKDGGDAVQAVDIVALMNRPNDLPKEERERRAKDGEPAISDNVMRIALGKHRYGDPSISGTFGWDHGRIVPLGYSWVDWAEGYENGSRSSE